MRFQRSGVSFPTCGCKTHCRGQKYHSCGVKMTCADASFTGAASKLTCAALISSVRQHFYHWNSAKRNMYVRIINVQTGTHSGGVKSTSRGENRPAFWVPQHEVCHLRNAGCYLLKVRAQKQRIQEICTISWRQVQREGRTRCLKYLYFILNFI